jgi:hypothetical protein
MRAKLHRGLDLDRTEPRGDVLRDLSHRWNIEITVDQLGANWLVGPAGSTPDPMLDEAPCRRSRRLAWFAGLVLVVSGLEEHDQSARDRRGVRQPAPVRRAGIADGRNRVPSTPGLYIMGFIQLRRVSTK